MAPELSAVYTHMVDECGAAIAAVIGCVSAPGGLSALIHCSAGKDRTGLLAALILAAIGVDDDVMRADYALSRTYLLAERAAAVRQVRASTGLGQRLDLQLMRVSRRRSSLPPWPGSAALRAASPGTCSGTA